MTVLPSSPQSCQHAAVMPHRHTGLLLSGWCIVLERRNADIQTLRIPSAPPSIAFSPHINNPPCGRGAHCLTDFICGVRQKVCPAYSTYVCQGRGLLAPRVGVCMAGGCCRGCRMVGSGGCPLQLAVSASVCLSPCVCAKSVPSGLACCAHPLHGRAGGVCAHPAHPQHEGRTPSLAEAVQTHLQQHPMALPVQGGDSPPPVVMITLVDDG